MTRDPAIDPQPGDKVEHRDGGQFYVLARTPRMVQVSMSLNARRWLPARRIRLSTFQRDAVGGVE
jgi:hypothetical protein